MDAKYSMDLKLQKANWNQYGRFYDGYYSIAVGNVEDTILTYCRADIRMSSIERSKDLIGFLLVLRSICAKNNGAVNSFQSMLPYMGAKKGSFFRGCFSLKNRSYCPLLRHSTSPFKSTCLLTRLKVLPFGLYGPHLRC
jgi:hypothetical protein